MELEHLQGMSESRTFYQRLNESRKEFQPRTTVCRSKVGEILGSDELILERWSQHFDELLNGSTEFELEEPTTAVSYTHLDVYKRQHIHSLTHSLSLSPSL